ncbi:hypothetical protein CANFE03_11470 [Ligilactobacillus animalis]
MSNPTLIVTAKILNTSFHPFMKAPPRANIIPKKLLFYIYILSSNSYRCIILTLQKYAIHERQP